MVGQSSEHTDPGDVGRILGLVELDPRPVRDTDLMSEASYKEKVRRGWVDRWIYAMPIVRAWRIGREIQANHIASQTYSPNNARAIGGNAMLLQQAEAEAILRLPVKKVAIYGIPDWIPDPLDTAEMTAAFAVSQGPIPSFAERTSRYEDGENYLYVMQLIGGAEAFIARATKKGGVVVKIGRSNCLSRRLSQLNFGFPPAFAFQWKIRNKQKFRSANDAHAAEQQLLLTVEHKGYSIGKEFAVIPEREIDGLVAEVSLQSAFFIRG